MADDTVRINGKALSAASVIWKLAGLTLEGWKTLGWGAKRERGVTYPGSGLAPNALTRGKTTYEVLAATMRLETANLVKAHLAQLTGTNSYGDAQNFPSTLQYVEGDKQPERAEFRKMWVASTKQSQGDNTDAAMVDMEFGYLELYENGLTIGPAKTPQG